VGIGWNRVEYQALGQDFSTRGQRLEEQITLLRRLANGEPVLQAHRSHFYQRAMDGGFSVYQVVGRVFLVNIALITLAAATLLTTSYLLHAAALIAGCVLVAFLLYHFATAKA
jgi:hypothetical protein